MTLVRVAVCFDFCRSTECSAEYVVYVRKMDLDDSLSLNPNRCHHPLITQLSVHCEKNQSSQLQKTFNIWNYLLEMLKLDFNRQYSYFAKYMYVRGTMRIEILTNDLPTKARF